MDAYNSDSTSDTDKVLFLKKTSLDKHLLRPISVCQFAPAGSSDHCPITTCSGIRQIIAGACQPHYFLLMLQPVQCLHCLPPQILNRTANIKKLIQYVYNVRSFSCRGFSSSVLVITDACCVYYDSW